MLRILCCVALISLTVAGKIDFKDCNNGEVKEFRIENCDGKNCTIKQGGHFLFGLDYVASKKKILKISNLIKKNFYIILL